MRTEKSSYERYGSADERYGRLSTGALPDDLYQVLSEASLTPSTPLQTAVLREGDVANSQALRAFGKWNHYFSELVASGPAGARTIVKNLIAAEAQGLVELDRTTAQIGLLPITSEQVIKLSKSETLLHIGLIRKDGENWDNLTQLKSIGIFGDVRANSLIYLMRPGAPTLINLHAGRVVTIEVDVPTLCKYRSIYIDPEMLNGYEPGERVGDAWVVPGGIPWEAIKCFGPWRFEPRQQTERVKESPRRVSDNLKCLDWPFRLLLAVMCYFGY